VLHEHHVSQWSTLGFAAISSVFYTCFWTFGSTFICQIWIFFPSSWSSLEVVLLCFFGANGRSGISWLLEGVAFSIPWAYGFLCAADYLILPQTFIRCPGYSDLLQYLCFSSFLFLMYLMHLGCDAVAFLKRFINLILYFYNIFNEKECRTSTVSGQVRFFWVATLLRIKSFRLRFYTDIPLPGSCFCGINTRVMEIFFLFLSTIQRLILICSKSDQLLNGLRSKYCLLACVHFWVL